MKLAFTVDTKPYPQPRPRVVRGHAFEPKRITDYKNLIRCVAKIHMADKPIIRSPIYVHIHFRKNRDTTSRAFGDADNLAKAVLDALNGIIYTDDSYVVRLGISKQKSKHEGVDITVSDKFV